MNWLDFVIALIFSIAVITGFARGFVRIGIGLAATLTGFMMASWFYGLAGSWLQPYVKTNAIANLLGFFLVFLGVILAGALIAAIASRVLKFAGLSWLDRLMGGAAGAAQGLLVVIVLVMALVAFTPNPPPSSVVNSTVAPHVIGAAGWLASVAPFELKDSFRTHYNEVKKIWSDTLANRKRLPLERH